MAKPLRLALLCLLPLAACAPPEPPAAQQEAAREPPPLVRRAAASRQETPTRLTPTLTEPLGLWLGDRTPSRLMEPAPLPNRDIEAPRARVADSLDPRIEPMLLPPERRLGATFGSEHLRETGPDRPLDNVLPGARLRIPFESEPRR
jgi:hypothetical protein